MIFDNLIKQRIVAWACARLTEKSTTNGILIFIGTHGLHFTDPVYDALKAVIGSVLALAAVVIQEEAAGHAVLAPAPVANTTVDLNRAELARHE